MSQIHRSGLRDHAITFRVDGDTKQQLLVEAEELGVSMQVLLERRLLGLTDARDLRPGPSTHRDQELPLTG